MAMIKPMEIAFGDINHIIIDIYLVECHCVLFHLWVSECPNNTPGDFPIWCANIAAIIPPCSVYSDLQAKSRAERHNYTSVV